MFGSFFKKVGLSISMLFSSMTSVFHKPKDIKNKPVEPVKIEQVVEEPVFEIVVTPVREKTDEEKIKDIDLEIEILKSKKRKLKENIIKEEQKRIMAEIDERLAKRPKNPEKWEVAAVCFLTDDQVRAILPDALDIKNMKSVDEENDIFV